MVCRGQGGKWIGGESKMNRGLRMDTETMKPTHSANKIIVDVQLRPLLDDLEVDIGDIKEYISKLKENEQLKAKIEQLKAELEQSVKLPCRVGDEFYCIAHEENPRVMKVFCDGYGIIKNSSAEPGQRFLWMVNIERPADYWKIDFSIFNEKMFKTREEAEQSLKG